ncbi:MAG TPA: right-handed parallel beta-helix repeat-containing protein [Acidobacteriaceae bacterium]
MRPPSPIFVLAATLAILGLPLQYAHASTYRVDCTAEESTSSHSAPTGATLRSIDQVNALELKPGDTLSFRRGTVCHGALHPLGSGGANRVITISAYGEGPLPRIEAAPSDTAALTLFNQSGWSIDSIDLRGGTTYGVFISAAKGRMEHINLRNLTVSGVRGPLRSKDSGLVVIKPSSPEATLTDVHVQGVRAFGTTQWAGIFVAGGSLTNPATNVSVDSSSVHDVQGDGIVIFNATDAAIRNSAAWHTGMQHAQTLGTPNAIWTWQCNRCIVENNEAFLTDSPGVDGGAFDIDWGNTANQVLRNFGHDTQGYCVSVFAAEGPTTASTVDGNLCLANGLSPRLAQRQGAILLMTWNGGVIDGLHITGNRVDWRAGGNTPVIQSGSKLSATDIVIDDNELHTTGTALVDSVLAYTGAGNHYLLSGASLSEVEATRQAITASGHQATIAAEPLVSTFTPPSASAKGWRLVATTPNNEPAALDRLFVLLETASLEYGHAGLQITFSGSESQLQAAQDWGLPQDGVQIAPLPPHHGRFALELIAPNGKPVATWEGAASVIDFGLALRSALGEPIYGRLPIEQVKATD